jgi:hypothetical protein
MLEVDGNLPAAEPTISLLEILMPDPGNHPRKVPETLREVDLPGRIRAAGGANLKEAGEFFGWEPMRVTKSSADFTKDELLARGWTKERLLDVAEGYDHVTRITPNNPSAAGRAAQVARNRRTARLRKRE